MMPSAHRHGGTAGARLPSQTWPSPARPAVQNHQPHERYTLLTQRRSWARTARSLPVAGLDNVRTRTCASRGRTSWRNSASNLLPLFADLSAPFRPHIRHLGHMPARRVLGRPNTVSVPFVHAPPSSTNLSTLHAGQPAWAVVVGSVSICVRRSPEQHWKRPSPVLLVPSEGTR